VANSLRNSHGHAAVFEGSGWVHALNLQPNLLGTNQLGKRWSFNQRSAAFTKSDDRSGAVYVETVKVFTDNAAP
jgi:hypothetical protein